MQHLYLPLDEAIKMKRVWVEHSNFEKRLLLKKTNPLASITFDLHLQVWLIHFSTFFCLLWTIKNFLSTYLTLTIIYRRYAVNYQLLPILPQDQSQNKLTWALYSLKVENKMRKC